MRAPATGTSPHRTPLWLSHHWPEHDDRCVHIGRLHICRRCLVLYPLTLATVVVVAVLDVPFGGSVIAAMWLLPLPMVLEWIAEHAGRASYSPSRQVAFAALAAPALGLALAEHLRHPFTPAAVAPVLCYAAVCALSSIWAVSRRPEEQPDWEAEHEAFEAARLADLRARLDDVATPDAGVRIDPAVRHDR